MSRTNERNRRFPGVILSEQDIEEILRRGVESKVLDFSGANLSGDQPLFIADNMVASKHYSFSHVDLSGTKMNAKGFDAILNSVAQLQTVEVLLARDNNLPKDVGMAISRVIGAHGSLKVLDLSGNKLGDIGVAAIAGIFGMVIPPDFVSRANDSLSLYHLTVLDLSNNDFGDMGLLALCRGLTQFVKHSSHNNRVPALKVLRLNRNKLTDKAASCLALLIHAKRASPASGGSQSKSASLALEELSLTDNPQLSAKGICALLGSPSDGIVSPLKRLLVARCMPNMSVLEQLANNLRWGGSQLEHLGMEFTEAVAYEVLRESAQKFNKIENSYSGFCPVSVALKQLVEVVTLNSTLGDALRRVDLGALPRCVFNSCVSAVQAKQVNQYQDAIKALDCLNSASDLFGVQYVSHIKGWVTDAVYDNRKYFATRPAPAAPAPAPANKQHPIVEPATPASGATPKDMMQNVLPASSHRDGSRSNFLSNLQTQIGSRSSSPEMQVGVHVLEKQQSSKEVQVVRKRSFSTQDLLLSPLMDMGDSHPQNGIVLNGTAPSSKPTALSSSQHGNRINGVSGGDGGVGNEDERFLAQLSGKIEHLESAYGDLLVIRDPSATSATSTAAPYHKTDAAATSSGFGFEEQSGELAAQSVLELKEQEYLRMRKDRSTALHTLASEIQLLMESSPTREDASREHHKQQRSSEKPQFPAAADDDVSQSKPVGDSSEVLLTPVIDRHNHRNNSNSNSTSTSNHVSDSAEKSAGSADRLHQLSSSSTVHFSEVITTSASTSSSSSSHVMASNSIGNNVHLSGSESDMSRLGVERHALSGSDAVNTSPAVSAQTPGSLDVPYAAFYPPVTRAVPTNMSVQRPVTGSSIQPVQPTDQQTQIQPSAGNAQGAGSEVSAPVNSTNLSQPPVHQTHSLPAPQPRFEPVAAGGGANGGSGGVEESKTSTNISNYFSNAQPNQSNHSQDSSSTYGGHFQSSHPPPLLAVPTGAQQTQQHTQQQHGEQPHDMLSSSLQHGATQQFLALLQAQVRSMEIRQQTTETAIFSRLALIENRLAVLESAPRQPAAAANSAATAAFATPAGVSGSLSDPGNTLATSSEMTEMRATVQALGDAVARTNKLLAQQSQQQRGRSESDAAADIHKSLSQRIMNGLGSAFELNGGESGSNSSSDLKASGGLKSSNAESVAVLGHLACRLEQLESAVRLEKEAAQSTSMAPPQQAHSPEQRQEKHQQRHDLVEKLRHSQELRILQQQQQQQQQQLQNQQQQLHYLSVAESPALTVNQSQYPPQQQQYYPPQQRQHSGNLRDRRGVNLSLRQGVEEQEEEFSAIAPYDPEHGSAVFGPAVEEPEYDFAEHRHHYHFANGAAADHHNNRSSNVNSRNNNNGNGYVQQHESQSPPKFQPPPLPAQMHFTPQTARKAGSRYKNSSSREEVVATPYDTSMERPADVHPDPLDPLHDPRYSDDPAQVNPPLFRHQQSNAGTVRLRQPGASYLRSIKAVPALPALPLLPSEQPEVPPGGHTHDQQHQQHSQYHIPIEAFTTRPTSADGSNAHYPHYQAPASEQQRLHHQHNEADTSYSASLADNTQFNRLSGATPLQTERDRPVTNRDVDLLVKTPRPFVNRATGNKQQNTGTGNSGNKAVMPEYHYDTLLPATADAASASTKSNHNGSSQHPTHNVQHGKSATPAFMFPTSSHQSKLWAKAGK